MWILFSCNYIESPFVVHYFPKGKKKKKRKKKKEKERKERKKELRGRGNSINWGNGFCTGLIHILLLYQANPLLPPLRPFQAAMETNSNDYKLRCELTGHEDDVRPQFLSSFWFLDCFLITLIPHSSPCNINVVFESCARDLILILLNLIIRFVEFASAEMWGLPLRRGTELWGFGIWMDASTNNRKSCWGIPVLWGLWLGFRRMSSIRRGELCLVAWIRSSLFGTWERVRGCRRLRAISSKSLASHWIVVTSCHPLLTGNLVSYLCLFHWVSE